MKASHVLLVSAFALLVASTPAPAPECLLLEASGLIETIAGTLCGTQCTGADGDCDSSCPYCSCGYCKSTQPPKLRRAEMIEDIQAFKRDDIPTVFKKEVAAACGGKCTTGTDCAYPCGNCHGGYCAGRIKAVRQAPSMFDKKDNCGAPCSTEADCDCGLCIAGKCGYGP
ncbi:hypothetical protein V8E51_009567 [Hyaloscypha variabilis]